MGTYEYVGLLGTGVFNQSSGTHTSLYTYIGSSGHGLYFHSGGSYTIGTPASPGLLMLGYQPGGPMM